MPLEQISPHKYIFVMIHTLLKYAGLIVATSGILLSLAKDMFEVESVTTELNTVHMRYVYGQDSVSFFRRDLYRLAIYVFVVTFLITLFSVFYYILRPHLKPESLSSFQELLTAVTYAITLSVLVASGYLVATATYIRRTESTIKLQGTKI